MELATYGLYVDWNGDGDYGDAGENVSSDWISISISRGFNAPLARFPTVGRMTVTLKNAAQTYSPPATATARPRKAVRLTMTYDGDTVVLFEGWIDRLRPEFGTTRSRRAVLECVDAVEKLDRFTGDIAIRTNIKADELIGDVVSAVYTPGGTNYEVGINTFPVACDRWEGKLAPGGMGASVAAINEVRAADKIQDACTADWGRFFIAKNGYPTFYNRHHMPLYATTDLTLDDTMTGMAYQMGATDVYNYVEVTCHPRWIGETTEVLGSVTQHTSTIIEAGEAVTFDIAFRDPANNAVQLGGMDIVTPVANTDFVATDDEAGEGTDETGNVTPTVSAFGERAEVEMANGAAYPVFLQSLHIRGTAIRTGEPVTLIAQDATSIAANGKLKLAVDAALMNSEVEAQTLANYLLDYYKDPLHDVRNVEFFANTNATLMEAARDLELLQRVVITESQTGLSAVPMFIYALRHTIEPGRVHRVGLDLEQAYDFGTPFIIESSLIDGTDVIVY